MKIQSVVTLFLAAFGATSEAAIVLRVEEVGRTEKAASCDWENSVIDALESMDTNFIHQKGYNYFRHIITWSLDLDAV